MNIIIKRLFGTNSMCCSVNRESRMLRKLINGREKGNKKWYANPVIKSNIGDGGGSNNSILSSARELTKTSNRGKEAIRRVAVLNKLFMTHITDRMATGEVSEFILGHGIQISRVKITNDFQKLNVFWIASGNKENDKLIEDVLNKSAGSIRHELSQLRLMGEVPKIYFLKDIQYSKIAEVDLLLEKADFGPDYQSATVEERIKMEFNMLGQDDDSKSILPKMNNNVFGLNQEEIMRKIKVNMGKTKMAWEKYDSANSNNSLSSNDTLLMGQEQHQQQQPAKERNNNKNAIVLENKNREFAKFLRDRQLQQTKRIKQMDKLENDNHLNE